MESDVELEGMIQRMTRQGQSFSGFERHCVFLNTTGRRFADISAVSGMDFPDDGRAIGVVDWDADGDLDLWIANRSGPQVRFLRNDTSTDCHHLSVRLIGTTSNRDAIGARVELHLKEQSSENSSAVTGHSPLLKTVRAGDAFLAQSSKWVHFGLGVSTEIDRLVVRWPGGEQEVFRGLEADGRYEIKEGTGEARAWSQPPRAVQLEPSRLEAPSPQDVAQIWLDRRIPMPKLPYTTMNGEKDFVTVEMGKPMLLNLWASWCRPCATELKEFAECAAEIEAAGLNVLALSVDGVDEPSGNGQEDARQMVSKLSFPLPYGMATAQLVDVLDTVHNFVFDFHQPLPLPTSILIDREGFLAAIYKGPVSIDRLLSDVKKLSIQDAVREYALPFSGRALDPPLEIELSVFPRRLLSRGFAEEATDYVQRYEQHLREFPDFTDLLVNVGLQQLQRGQQESSIALFRKALDHEAESAYANMNLGAALVIAGRQDEGVEHLREALRINPDYSDAYRNLGRAFLKVGMIQEAGEHFQLAVQKDSEHASAHHDLGRWLKSQGKLDQAVVHLREAIRLQPDNADALSHLGMILGQQNQLDEATSLLQEAVRLRPGDSSAHLNLGVVLGFQSKFAEAVESLRRAAEIHPDSESVQNNLGFALCAHGKMEEGMERYRTALKLNPTFVNAHNNLGFALMKQSNFQEAMKHFRQSVKFAPNRADGYYNLALVFESQGQFEKAIEHCQQALKIHPGYVSAERKLDELLQNRSNGQR